MNATHSPTFSASSLTDRPASSDKGHAGILQRIAALSVLVALLSGCGGDAEQNAEVEPAPRPVRVDVVTEIENQRLLRLDAALAGVRRADLAFLHPGTLAERQVVLGQQVEAGDELAVLHNPALQPGVAAAEARVDEARTRLRQLEQDTQRQQTLVERNLIAEDDLDQTRTRRDAARASLAQARASLEEARNQLSDARLRAPFAGTVARFMIEPGDFAAAGQPVMSLVTSGALEAEVALPAELRPDAITSARMLRPADASQATAEVAQAGAAAPGRPRALRLRPDPDASAHWQPGDAVYVELDLGAARAVTVPLAALIDPGTGVAHVFRVRDGRAERISVQTGRLTGNRVTVIGDLQPNDRVVVAGQALLLDGEAVRILQ